MYTNPAQITTKSLEDTVSGNTLHKSRLSWKKVGQKALKYTKNTAKAIYYVGLMHFCVSEFGQVFTPEVNVSQASKIVSKEQERTYLSKKEIELKIFGKDLLDKYAIGGVCYSYDNKFYIGLDTNDINKFALYHEIGHVIANNADTTRFPSTQSTYIEAIDKISTSKASLKEHEEFIENCFSNGQKEPWFAKIGNLFAYYYDPEEMFCNLYATYSSIAK